MLERKKIQSLDDYFVDLEHRQDKGVYFYRIFGYSEEVKEFVKKYYEAARGAGVVIEGKIPNPDEKNLSYYSEMMGLDFLMDLNFITERLGKWLPRMSGHQRQGVAASLYAFLSSMREAGKTENMLKNAYIKFMCWLYYKFERILNQLGESRLPKILYEGDISKHELMLLSVLSGAGCDVALLQLHGDQPYLKVDAAQAYSDALTMEGLTPFPEGFCLKRLREEMQEERDRERLLGERPSLKNCTNAWATGKGLADIREGIAARGSDPVFFYNCFCRIHGVEDKLTYANELYRLQRELKNEKRKAIIVNEAIPKPTPEEIARIKRGRYANWEQMLMDLGKNLRHPSNIELQRLMNQAWIDIVSEAAGKEGVSLNKLTNQAVYLLCWLQRYAPLLFSGWRSPEIACFIFLGGCKTKSEAMFLSLLARLPTDVLILCPNLNVACCLSDQLLLEVHYSESLALDKYPEESSQVRIGTAAYHAERELDALMYQDSGMYRNQQYRMANAISLQTMYEEIKILWDQEVKYRPNFSAADGAVSVPVIFAKVSGVKGGLLPQYWASINGLVTQDSIVVKRVPYINPLAANPIKPYAAEFLKGKKVQKARIKGHPAYQYGILREEMQDFILEKAQALLDQRLIRGIGENGAEYAVIATILNLPKEILRLIQKFDFTKKNPKFIYVHAAEAAVPLEDAIVAAFLNLICFDVIFFVPTGYQGVERHFTKQRMEEHQVGEYLYDVSVPDLSGNPLSRRARPSWRDIIFKRGG